MRELRDEGVAAIYGDATRPDMLEAAGVPRRAASFSDPRGWPTARR